MSDEGIRSGHREDGAPGTVSCALYYAGGLTYMRKVRNVGFIQDLVSRGLRFGPPGEAPELLGRHDVHGNHPMETHRELTEILTD